MGKTDKKVIARSRRRRKIRGKIHGTAERPRLFVFRSARHIYAQIINDDLGTVLACASTMDSELKGALKYSGNVEAAKQVGSLLAKRAATNQIETVSFDRGGYRFHGRVKALGEAAREGGLNF
ncbi:MAG: 50S ribosomal protein L18 [bacterium]